jgi:hypothetical protein
LSALGVTGGELVFGLTQDNPTLPNSSRVLNWEGVPVLPVSKPLGQAIPITSKSATREIIL